MPGDVQATSLLQQAQAAWNDAKLAAADTAKKQTLYADAIKLGQSALLGKKYDDAIKAFESAGKLMPGDAQAAKLLKQAQVAQADAIRIAQEEAKAAKLEQQKKTQFGTLMKEASAAFDQKKYTEAKSLLQEALKLYPMDAGALRGLKDASAALDAAKTPPKDNKALYQKAMKDGSGLEQQGKYADAIKKYNEALQLMPNDTQASNGVRRAQFGQHMADGQRFLDGAQWVNAQREFEAALKINPNDQSAKKLLEKAKQKMK